MDKGFWNTSSKRRIYLRSEQTVLKSFFKLCSEMPEEFVCKDEALGFLTYNKMRKAVIALASQLTQYPDECVGVMMPASAGAYIAYFAILLAGKIPVMMNWTQGARELQACAKLTNIHHVLTSAHLVQHMKRTHRVHTYPFTLLCIESSLRELTIWQKVRIVAYAYMPRSWLWKMFPCGHQKATDTAVILFTSGTEKTPKAVPLTHANLHANQEACFQFFNPQESDIMMSFLPPFHAYGFSSCSLFPILAGVPLVFIFNPLHSKKIVEALQAMRVTILGSTPLFFSYLLHAAQKQGVLLDSLRFIIIGGEAFKHPLYQLATQYCPHAKCCQGYGTTECSPVITINTERLDHELCVGRPIGGMEIRILSETMDEVLPIGETGVIVVHGTSVFPGYLGEDPMKGFLEREGKRWYITGDLGSLNEQGELFLQGRLSRFVKLGGEMISLEAMESILLEAFILKQVVAGQQGDMHVVVSEVPGDKAKFCIFTSFDTSLQEVNQILKDAQTSNLMRIVYHHRMETIPMLGSGKPNYGALNKLAQQLFGS